MILHDLDNFKKSAAKRSEDWRVVSLFKAEVNNVNVQAYFTIYLIKNSFPEITLIPWLAS